MPTLLTPRQAGVRGSFRGFGACGGVFRFGGARTDADPAGGRVGRCGGTVSLSLPPCGPPGSDVAPDLRQSVETPSARLIRSAPGPDLDERYVVPASGPRSPMARVGRTVFWRPCGPGREHGLVRSLWCNCVAVTDAQVKRSPMRFALLRFAVPGCEARVAVAQG